MRTVDAVKHDEKKREILVAAARCFGRSGFQGATIASICAEARISPGHLYHYFAGKEAIVRAMAESHLARAEKNFRDMEDGADAVSALLGGMKRRSASEFPGRSIQLDLMAEASRNPAIAEILRDHSQALRDHLALFLRTGQAKGQVDPELDPNAAASVLLSLMDGARTLSVRDPDQDITQSLALMQAMIVRFLKPQAEPSKA